MMNSAEELYCAEQIHIPITFPEILKCYAKAAIRTQPYDLLSWTTAYFRALANGEEPPVKERLDHPPFTHPTGLTPSYLRILFNQFGRPPYATSSCVITLKSLFERWQGISLADLLLYRILKIGCILHDQIDLYRFLAIACGLMSNNLRDTMILVCELFTSEPPGGSAMIPIKILANLYGYLASLDCGSERPAENRKIGSAVETYSPDDSRAEELEETLLPSTISGESASICTCVVSAESLKNGSSEESCSEAGGLTHGSGNIKSRPTNKGLVDEEDYDAVHSAGQSDKTSTDVLENDDGKSDGVVKGEAECLTSSLCDNGEMDIACVENFNDDNGRRSTEIESLENAEDDGKDVVEDNGVNVFTKTVVDVEDVGEESSEWLAEGEKKSERDIEEEYSTLGNIQGLCECPEEVEKAKTIGKEMIEASTETTESVVWEGFAELFTRRIEERHTSLVDVIDYYVPGIGGVVSTERVNAVLVWLMSCSRRQDGYVGPRNLRHFMCPRLFDECFDNTDCDNCGYEDNHC